MNNFTGTRALTRLAFRRDRWILTWILYLGVLPITFASSFAALYKTAAERADFAHESATNATFVALYGPLKGSSLGELVAWRSGFLFVIIGLISLLNVIRHTRVEEESGRSELIGAAIVGRQAGLAAALLETALANVAFAAVVALTMMSKNLSITGSIALGVEFVCVSWMFAAVGAVAAQLATLAGRARAIAIAVLVIAYVLRIVGDLRGRSHDSLSWISWISPIGLAQHMQPYAHNHWWIAGICLVIAIGISTVAMLLSARRDLGAGLLQPSLGPSEAAPRLNNAVALAWRLQRGLFVGWLIGMTLIGVVLGSVAKSAGDLAADSQQARDIITRIGGQSSLVDAYLSAIMGILALSTSAYAIQAVLKLRAEESDGRAEPVLATAISRSRWAYSHLVFAFSAPTTVILAAGLTTGLLYGLSTHDVGEDMPRVFAAAAVQLPAIWILTAIAFAVVGVLPRFTSTAWGALVACLLVTFVGSALQLSHWVLDISPFSHVPKLPGGDLSITPLAALAAVAIAFCAIGFAGIRKRSIPQ
jgi:ABC-2 type transport system permease protein